jgi:hypothetical protein
MALSESLAAYDDCFNLFDRAHADGKGIRTFVQTWPEAHMLRMRLNNARVLDRRQSMKAYPKDAPQFGKSEHDRFKVTIRKSAEDDGYWVYIELWAADIIVIEGLSDESERKPL